MTFQRAALVVGGRLGLSLLPPFLRQDMEMLRFLNPLEFARGLANYTEGPPQNYSVHYQHTFDLERLPFTSDQLYRGIQAVWHHTFTISAIYLAIIFGIQALMRNRPALELRRPLIVWNALLALFSFIAALRLGEEFFAILTTHGLHASLCLYNEPDTPNDFWLFLFMLSKIWEMGDTIFIVLRKKPLIFLHYYHHCITMIYTWRIAADGAASGRWFQFMNLFAHSVMYTYFFVTALGRRPPRAASITVTSVQIMQLFLAFGACLVLTYYKHMGIACHISDAVLFLGLIMYGSFVYLFCKFFVNAYLRPKKKPTKFE